APVRLVPIRIDIELPDGSKLRDTFTWNLTDRHITPELFARRLCEDLAFDIPLTIDSISQLHSSARSHSGTFNTAPISLIYDDELRVLIKLRIVLAGQVYSDQFDWDII
ncbi:SNF5-domain-containing protein, partial [Ramicandelaber brevisporus]